MMRAIRVTPPLPIHSLRVTEVPRPRPGAGEVLVELRAAALNHRELLILRGEWPEWGTYTLGSDGAGIVTAVGSGVKEVELGAAVVINPGLGWGSDQRAPLSTFNTLGGPRDGTFADAVLVPAKNVRACPSDLNWEEAAAVPVAGLTTYRAIVVRARLRADETLLVHGIGGGVAQASLAIAGAIGATTIVTSSSEAKLARAQTLGATYGINYQTEDWTSAVTELTEGRGPDVVLDSIGGETLSRSVKVVRRGGRVVSLGVTTGPAPNFPIRPLYVRHVDLLGTTLGSPEDFAAMLAFFGRHKIRPVVDSVFALEEISQAMALLERGAQFGKIVLRM